VEEHEGYVTKCMWAIFNETGIFLALCRHGFSLVIADMVQSGELYVTYDMLYICPIRTKYPLGVVEKMLDVLERTLVVV
jgi:Kyakuja-Dileera-Zisupton transposase